MTNRLGSKELRALNQDYFNLDNEVKRPSSRFSDASTVQSASPKRGCCGCLSSLIDRVKNILKRLFFCFFPKPTEGSVASLRERVSEPVSPPVPVSPISPLPPLTPPRPLSPVPTPTLPSLPIPEISIPRPAPIQPPAVEENPYPDLPDEYSIEKERVALREAHRNNVQDEQLSAIRKKFSEGRSIHGTVCALYSYFQSFHNNPELSLALSPQGPNIQVFSNIINLFPTEDSERLAKLFDKILKIKIFKGVLSVKETKSGLSLLHAAALYGHDEIVKKMLDYGCDPLFKTIGIYPVMEKFGDETFYYEIKAGKNYLEFARDFHEQRVKYYFHRQDGYFFLNQSLNHHSRDFPLIDHRLFGAVADMNQPDVNGETLLHLALTNNFSIPVILALLEKGANPLIVNKQGKSSLDLLLSMSEEIWSGKSSIILPLFLDAASAFDPKNLEKYKKIKNEQVPGRNFLHLILDRGIFTHMQREFEICKNLEKPYNPFAFAFERMDPWEKDHWKESAYDRALRFLSEYNENENKDEIDALKTFILPLFEQRIAVTNEARTLLTQPPANIPSAVMDIIASYLVIDPEIEAHRANKRASCSWI